LPTVIVYAVVDDSLSATSPLGDAVDTFIRHEDAERFVEEVFGDDPEVASYLRIEERELGGCSGFTKATDLERCDRPAEAL
jgi:hypothetical protein